MGSKGSHVQVSVTSSSVSLLQPIFSGVISMSLLTLLQGNNGAGSLIWNLTSWCWPTAPTAPTTLPWSSLARRLSRWLRLAMTWTQFELFALLYKCRCPGGRLPASPRLCSGIHGRGEQSICGYYQQSVFIACNIYRCEINFYLFSFKLLWVPLHLLHMTRLLLEWKKSK